MAGRTGTRFTFELTLGNDTMKTPNDVARALVRIARVVEMGVRSGGIADDNGNAVGRFRLTGEWPE
jgi:hypothetical protein